MRLVHDDERQASSWRVQAAAQLRHVATSLEVEQLPGLSAYVASSVQDVIAHFRDDADNLIANGPGGAS